MSKHFTHLHLHTEFSLLDGAIRLPDLITFAKQQQWKAVGISDHGNIFGAVKFFQLARKENIKPILGIEMYFTPDVKIKSVQEKYCHLIVIVQNKTGYKNLCRMLAFAYQEGFYFKPRIDYATLEKYNEGLVVTTACIGGHIPRLLRHGQFEEAASRIEWFKGVFGKDRFFFELSPPEFEKQKISNNLLLEYAQKHDVRCIASCDAHYLHKEDHEAHEALLAVQTKDELSNPERFSFKDFRGYVRTTDEMLQAFKGHEELIWNTGTIADSCDFDFEFDKLFFPQFVVPETYTQESYFKKLCVDGLERIKHEGNIPADQHDVYDARLHLEIELIVKMGFVGYLLVVSDFIQWAKRNGIAVGAGRGSVAGALVAWAMQITNVDPIKYNLLFERFLNPERVSMPDIDIDFCVERREEVINYVKDKYGHDCVCQIITFGTMMAKGVIKDVGRVMGLPFQDTNMVTELIPEQLKITLKEAIEQEPRLQDMIASNGTIKKLFDIAFRLEGLTRHASKHAAGVVISPTPLAETLPLYIPPKTTDFVAQYAMSELEAIGFLKMDFLGLKNLTVIENALKAILENHGVSINLDKISFDDPKTFELLCNGNTNAVFQFESDGIKDVLRKLKPDKFEDLIAVNALYRPGPLGAGMVDDYIERRHGRQQVTYKFPELKPILEETYGVIVYQEQVMHIASAIAGYSLGAADILRRAMGKKKADVMEEQRALFVDGAKKRNFNEKKAGEVFDLMAFFAGYGFNKSHSTAYALIAYHTAYLKANYPNEFMAASISYETSNPDQMTHYLQEINDLGLVMIPPDINRSVESFKATKDGIVFGLRGIKSVGDVALANIIIERTDKPFADLLDFCKRIDLRTSNKRVIENLICAGAMDRFSGNRAQKIAELARIMSLAQDDKERSKTGQMGLFDLVPVSHGSSGEGYSFQPLADWTTREKLAKEKEVVGFYLSSHPLKAYSPVSWVEVISFGQALEKVKQVTSIKEPFVACLGLMQQHKIITTKKGDRMMFAQCEDLESRAEIIVFPKLFAVIEQWLGKYDIFLIKGVVDITSANACKIKAQEFIPLELMFEQEKLIKRLKLSLTETIQEQALKDIKEKLMQREGSVPMSIAFQDGGKKLVLESAKKVVCSMEALLLLEAIGVEVKVMLS